MEELSKKPKRDIYCIVYRENKGYYLSRLDIVEAMNLDVVAKGEKKYCLARIEKLNLKLEP